MVHTITPKVSVVMSVCDGERYLYDSLKSICNQTLDDFELIVVDDGSTDNTASVISSFSTNTSLNFSPEFLSFTIDTSGELSLAGGMALRLGNGRTVHLSQFNSSKRVLAAGELELGHKASQGTNHSGEFKKQ